MDLTDAPARCYVAVQHIEDGGMPLKNPLIERLAGATEADGGALAPFNGDFANPGSLRFLSFVPDALPTRAPLVVVLHGCTQTAAGYDRGAGWTTLAAQLGFAVLYPEQTRANNGNLCFNWFEAEDTTRGLGEPASIVAAVGAMVARHGLDPARVFVTGLSAGGAMTAVMLATYPDVFAGGAVIAGLPFGVANGVPEALSAMASPVALDGRALGDRVRAASGYGGAWPRVSIWHGGSDRTVSARNGEALTRQWLNVHGIGDAAPDESSDGIHGLSIWRNGGGVAVVELNRIDGMAHGTPLDAGADGQVAGPYMLDVGVASSARIAAFFGLIDGARTAVPNRTAATTAVPADPLGLTAHLPKPGAMVHGGVDVGQVIGDALRSAGLMR